MGKKTSIDTFKKQLVSDRADGLEKFKFGNDDAQYPIMELGMDCIDVEPQVRIEFQENEIDDLCSSIEKTMEMGVPYGLLQPVLVSIKDPVFKRYKLEAGERRYRAFKKLGRRTIPAIVIGQNASINSYVIQLYENIHRKNLHIIEKAHGVVQYVRVELAKMEAFHYPGDINELIRETTLKMNFKRELNEMEKIVSEILSLLKIPLGTLRNWFWATSFSDNVQRFFIEKKVPVAVIKRHVKLAGKPDDHVMEVFKRELGIGQETETQRPNYAHRKKLFHMRDDLRFIIGKMRKGVKLEEEDRKALEIIVALTDEIRKLAEPSLN